MDEKIICGNCGATCSKEDGYCRRCSQPLTQNETGDDQVIEGIDNQDLKEYIGKNFDYYYKKFKKAKGKDFFVQVNFPALFLGPTWFFYRKMNKIAAIYIAISLLVSMVFMIAVPTIMSKDVDEFYAAKKAYSEYLQAGGETRIYEEGYTTIGTIHPTYEKLRDDLKATQNKIRLMDLLITAPVLIVEIVLRLFANFLYRRHIIENIRKRNGGTSIGGAIGYPIVARIIATAVSFLLLLIPTVLRYQGALEMLVPWL